MRKLIFGLFVFLPWQAFPGTFAVNQSVGHEHLGMGR